MKFLEKLLNKKYIFVLCGILVVLILAVAFVANRKKQNLIAFYRIERNDVLELQKIIDKAGEEKKVKYRYMTLNESKSLELQKNIAKHAKMIFVPAGFAVETAVDLLSNASVSPEIMENHTASMKNSAVYNKSRKRILAVPVLADFLQIDFDTAELRNSDNPSMISWKDFETFAKYQTNRTGFPLVFAGKDPEFFLDLLGAIAESLDGNESYAYAASLIKKAAESDLFDEVKLVEKLADADDAPLATALKMMQKWFKNRYIYPGVFDVSKSDENVFLKQRQNSLAFFTLKDQRSFDQKAMGRFSSVFVPSEIPAVDRHFTAKLIYAVPIKPFTDVDEVIKAVVSKDGQEKLCRATGFAPVTTDAKTPDRQADDARYWIASTNAPNAGLSREAFLTNEQLEKIASELATRIKY